MLAIVLPLALQAVLAGAPPARAHVPGEVPLSGLLDLAREGEVALLPKPDTQPFNAIVITQSVEPCAAVAHEMLDVESWPSRWAIKDVEILERTPTSVTYSLQLDLMLAPRIPGRIDHPTPNKVIFNDVKTGAKFIWTLDDVAGGCAMRYSLLETPGKASGWVAAVKTLEPSVVDAANFAAALSSARGFAKPRPAARSSAAGKDAFAALADHGTAMRILRRPGPVPVVVARRVVERPLDEVLWSIRDKHRYEDKIEVISRVKDGGRTSRYTVGAFGGRVTWDTSVVESGDAHTDDGLTIAERVTGGDLDAGAGGWTWLVRPVPGGTDVELRWDLDITPGSHVMSTLADADPIARESMAIHMCLALMDELIGGKPLGQRTLARVP